METMRAFNAIAGIAGFCAMIALAYLGHGALAIMADLCARALGGQVGEG